MYIFMYAKLYSKYFEKEYFWEKRFLGKMTLEKFFWEKCSHTSGTVPEPQLLTYSCLDYFKTFLE